MRIGPAGVLLFALFARAQDPSALERAISLQRSGETDQSIALLRELLARDPKFADAHNWLGVAYLQKNQLPEAEAEFREAIRQNPEYVRAYNNLGSTLAQAGDIPHGIEILRQGLKLAPSDFQLRLNLAMALRSKGEANEALDRFRTLLRDHADEPALQYQFGQTLRQTGDLEGAVTAFEKALELDPESLQASYALGQALRQMSARAVRSRSGPSEFLASGTRALSRGDFGAARQAAEKAIASDSTSAEAYHLLGFALWYAGDRNGAAAALDKSLRLNPAAAEVYSFRGMTHRDSGNLAEGRRMLLRSIALDPKRPLPYIDLAVVFLRQGQLERALGQFEAGLNLAGLKGLADLDVAVRELRLAIANKPDQAEAYRVLGRLLGAIGADPEQVIAAFQKAIELRPDDAEARNGLGLVYVQIGDDEKAIAAFRRAVEIRPEYADARQNLGAVLTTSDTAEAVRQLEAAIKLQPGLLKAQYNLALAYEASPQHGPAVAIEQIRKLLSTAPDYPRASFVLGRALLRQGQVKDAVEQLRRAVEREPDFGEARYQLGLALSRAGSREEGSAEIRRGRELIAAAENRQAAALDLVAAKVALDKGDRETAAAKARKILEFQPGSVEALAVLNAAAVKPVAPPAPSPKESIETRIREGKFDAAEQEARAYIAAQPKSAWAWYALGYSLYAQRKIGDSINALAQSLQLDVGNPDAHKVLGRDLMIIGRFDAAKIEFEQGKRLNPRSAEMPYNLGKLYSIQDNWADARREFEAAIRLDPAYMEAYDGLGFAMEALGDDAAAADNYRKAIELCEARRAGFASPYVNMSALSHRSGDHAAALEYARKALRANPQSDRALFHLAKAYEYQGDLNAAAEALRRAVELNPRSSSYFYVLATVYRKLGKPEDSRKAMDAFSRLDRESNELEQKRRDLLKEK